MLFDRSIYARGYERSYVRRYALGRALSLCLLVSGPATVALAADPNQPHPHQGAIPHFEGAPPIVELTTAEEGKLRAGEPIRKQVQRETSGRGVAVFAVDASPEVVWSVIADFPSYPEWIDSLKETEIYGRDGDNIFVRFKISTWAIDVEYFIKHNYPMASEGWGTWTLDYTKSSDLDDSVGYWRVSSIDGNPNRSRVEYSVDLKLRGWIPGFIKNLIVGKGLEGATSWVKVQAEMRAKPGEFAQHTP